MLQVRAARIEDSAAIGAIIRAESLHFLVDPEGPNAQRFYEALHPSSIEKMMTESARSYFVAEDGNEIVGMIMIRDQNYISQFFVSAQHQSKGIGGTLWRLALNSAMANGATGEFKVDSSLIARPIYESLGFAIAGEETVRAGFKFVSMHRPAASAA